MTVLGKIPAVPKPINLPSQRLENRGLDPNVEIVPRGSVSWGSAGRSPPTSNSAWGNSSQSSSPPVSGGAWGNTAKPGSLPNNNGVVWGGNTSRPSSAGSGTRPSSAGSIGQTQDVSTSVGAWGLATARPSSASGVLGQAQSQQTVTRPKSAETRTVSSQSPALTRFADHASSPATSPTPAWGGAGTARRLSEEAHQPARFQLTRVDFPTLGSEKNPDLRPQQSKTGAERPGSVDEKSQSTEDQPPNDSYEEVPQTASGGYGGPDRMPDGWRRENFPMGGSDGGWHRDGHPHMQPYGGPSQPADTWRRDLGHGPGGGSSDDNWRRGGGPLVGPYGPHVPGRFPHDPSGFMHQQRYGPGPGPVSYGRGGGPAPGYGRHGEMYGNAGPFVRPGLVPARSGLHLGPGMYAGPVPFETFYGPPGVPGPGFGNMDEREMMMHGMYGNFQHQGPPMEPFGHYAHGGPGPGSRHISNNSGAIRDRNDGMGYEMEGYRDGGNYKEMPSMKDGGVQKDGGSFGNESGTFKDSVRHNTQAETIDPRRGGSTATSQSGVDVPRPVSRGGNHHSHRDWGAAASSDEPMDFSKPVFEEDVSSSVVLRQNKKSLSFLVSGIDVSQTAEETTGTRLHNNSAGVAPVGKSNGEDVLDGPNAISFVQASILHSSADDSHQPLHQEEQDSGNGVVKNNFDVSNSALKDQAVKKSTAEIPEVLDKHYGKDSSLLASNICKEVASASHIGRAGNNKKDSSSASHMARTSQQSVSGARRSSTLSSSLRGSNTVPASEEVSEEGISMSANGGLVASVSFASSSSSASVSDDHANSERVRMLKRSGDAGSDSQQQSDVLSPDVLHEDAAVPSIPSDSNVKEEFKPKVKAISAHDGEKEWRPKVAVVDSALDAPRNPGPSKQVSSLASISGSSGAGVLPDKSVSDFEHLNTQESYDYEAQRVRMKAIAAQRARQLRKEEEERIKEQKSKALAKLEELNRRSLVVSESQPDEPRLEEGNTELVKGTNNELESDALSEASQLTVLVEAIDGEVTSAQGNTRVGRNEHGKRERVGDRKTNGRSREEHRVKVASGEHRDPGKGRLNVSINQARGEPSFLLSPSQQAPVSEVSSPPTALQTSSHQVDAPIGTTLDSNSSQVVQMAQQAPMKVRHRSKQYSSQQKQVRQAYVSEEADSWVLFPEPLATSENVDKTVGTPGSNMVSLEPETKESSVSVIPNSGNTEAVMPSYRKKKPKSSGRNKQKLEATTTNDFSSQASHVDITDVSVTNFPNQSSESGKPASQAVMECLSNNTSNLPPLSVHQDEVCGQNARVECPVGPYGKDTVFEASSGEMGIPKVNGDLQGKRLQRKTQPARRLARDNRSQDVRVADKPHGEGMVWAPVRSPSSAAASKPSFSSEVGVGGDSSGVKKEEASVPSPSGRARRAELERYTPKPVVKQHAQHQEEVIATPLTQNQVGDSHHKPTNAGDVPLVSEIRFGGEARHFDNGSRPGRSQASWRQRGTGNDRHFVQPYDSSDSFKSHHHSQQNYQRNRTSASNASDHYRMGGLQQPNRGVTHGNRQQTSSLFNDKEQGTESLQQQPRSSQATILHASSTSVDRAASNVPSDQYRGGGSQQATRGGATHGHRQQPSHLSSDKESAELSHQLRPSQASVSHSSMSLGREPKASQGNGYTRQREKR